MKPTVYQAFALIHITADKDKDNILLVPSYVWKDSLTPLYKPLECALLERTQVCIPGSNLLRWMWVDEEGHLRAKPINALATQVYQNKRITQHMIAGTAAIQLGRVEFSDERWLHAGELAEKVFGKEHGFNTIEVWSDGKTTGKA